MTTLSQRSHPHANTPIGKSKYLIHALGSSITLLAEIMFLTPLEVNEKLTAADCFLPDSTGELSRINWEKLFVAFPGYAAQYIEPYNNTTVLDALSKGQSVLVQAISPLVLPGEYHTVRYLGGGKCHDPYSGEETSTADFPDVKAMVLITKTSDLVKATAEEKKEEELSEENEVIAPPTGTEITLTNLPVHEKKAILKQLRIIKRAAAEVKSLLGV